MQMHHTWQGAGKPLLLVHGLGSNGQSWNRVRPALNLARETIAVDLPGFGKTPPLPGEVSIRTLADAVSDFIHTQNLTGVDVVGSSMGARLVLELARRSGVVGKTVALDPGGFWLGWQRAYFAVTVGASIKLVRLLQPVMPQITRSAWGRTLLFPQFSAHPWTLSPEVTLEEMRSYNASPSTDELLYNLAYGEAQQGAPRGTLKGQLTIGWGDRDRVCFPGQAARALALFPDAYLHWFENCGHFPQWDAPDETVRVILTGTA